MNVKNKCLIYLISMGIIDILVPVPIVGILLIYVLFQKPPWFSELVKEIYGAGV